MLLRIEFKRTILPSKMIYLFLQDSNLLRKEAMRASQGSNLQLFASTKRPRYLKGIEPTLQLRKHSPSPIHFHNATFRKIKIYPQCQPKTAQSSHHCLKVINYRFNKKKSDIRKQQMKSKHTKVPLNASTTRRKRKRFT